MGRPTKMEFEKAHMTMKPPLLTGAGLISFASRRPIASVVAIESTGRPMSTSGSPSESRSSEPKILLMTSAGMPAFIMSFVISPLCSRFI